MTQILFDANGFAVSEQRDLGLRQAVLLNAAPPDDPVAFKSFENGARRSLTRAQTRQRKKGETNQKVEQVGYLLKHNRYSLAHPAIPTNFETRLFTSGSARPRLHAWPQPILRPLHRFPFSRTARGI